MGKLISYTYIYLIPLVVSAGLGIKTSVRGWPKPFQLLALFLLASFCTECVAIGWELEWHRYGGRDYSPGNLWIYNAFIAVRHVFLLMYFRGVLTSAHIRTAINWSVWPFLLFALLNYFVFQGPHQLNNYTLVIANVITVILSVLFFKQVFDDEQVIVLRHSAAVWVALGTFVYYAGTLPLFIFFNYLVREHVSVALSYLYINDALNIVMYSCYVISFLCNRPSQKKLY